MRSRLFFLGIVAFWLAMNFALWRSQLGGHSGFGGTVPAATVWQKILTAPDNSTLDIYDHEEKIGVGHWGAGLADSPLLSNKILAQDFHPVGPDAKPAGFTLSFEGSAMWRGTNHVRFQASLGLDPRQTWREFHFRAAMRPNSWDLHAYAAEEKIMLKVEDDDGPWEKTLKFSDLRDPQSLLSDYADASTLGLLALNRNLLTSLGPGLPWEAHEDRMNLGHSNIRIYRLQTVIFGQRIEVLVSRVGEILWVNLPSKISLRNQALSTNGNG